ncbi:hypothetical protein Afil01_29320 [Actinorhabdospora filicis]|uniref:Excreted virulence factor EspC, type VII ESX diderm n=1 Tax=Actinorhabdospora filicis TaxID=1785913 RepID=A0A9W6WAX7_9ACTN|nr:hypothetical protein [Actinorhabdospora filicis]GLZ78125.1 hypothetical protein Afil01_29320 [Actinorhabdospora filicis]
MGEQVTGGDLFKLWQVANVYLPRAAKVYTDVNAGVAGTSNGEIGAFGRGENASGHLDGGRVLAAFGPLRNEFQWIIADTAQYLLDAQTALNKAIAEYGKQDAAAAADFRNNYLNNPDKRDTSDPSQNPPTGDYAPGSPLRPGGYVSPVEGK